MLVQRRTADEAALSIDEKSYGSEHPHVAIRLNNLAQLLKDTNRLEEAEPLMRHHVVIFLKFTHVSPVTQSVPAKIEIEGFKMYHR